MKSNTLNVWLSPQIKGDHKERITHHIKEEPDLYSVKFVKDTKTAHIGICIAGKAEESLPRDLVRVNFYTKGTHRFKNLFEILRGLVKLIKRHEKIKAQG